MKRHLYSVLLATGVVVTSGLSAIAAENSIQPAPGNKKLKLLPEIGSLRLLSFQTFTQVGK